MAYNHKSIEKKWQKYWDENEIFKGKNITAFAGIAYPEKFFNSLKEQKAKIVKEFTFPDHHIYNENDLLSLAENANKNNK